MTTLSFTTMLKNGITHYVTNSKRTFIEMKNKKKFNFVYPN